MQKWGKRGKIVTLVDLFHKQCSSWFFELKTSQELQEQLPSTSVAKVRCNGGYLCAIIRPNTHLYTQRNVCKAYVQHFASEANSSSNFKCSPDVFFKLEMFSKMHLILSNHRIEKGATTFI